MCKKIHTTYHEATLVFNVVDKWISLHMESLLVTNLSKIQNPDVFARYISSIRIK